MGRGLLPLVTIVALTLFAVTCLPGCDDEPNGKTVNDTVAPGESPGKANRKKSEEFLAANAKKEGVKTLPDGLQYIVLKEGTGKKPSATDEVEVHYHGTFIDGKVFDSSVERGEPSSFPVNRVIPGWTEALQLMKEGSKWKIFIPSDFAYGPHGRPPKIGPNQALVFEVELLHVK
jgi:FKBP-type peptidyl-prolyl cis-trans isomerase FklB